MSSRIPSTRTYHMLLLEESIAMPKGQLIVSDLSHAIKNLKNLKNFKEGEELVLLRRRPVLSDDSRRGNHRRLKENTTLTLDQLYSVGTLVKIASDKISSDQNYAYGRKVVFTGIKRFAVTSITVGDPTSIVYGDILETEIKSSPGIEARRPLVEQNIRKMCDDGMISSKDSEKILFILGTSDHEEMLDLLVHVLDMTIMELPRKQEVLETACLEERYDLVLDNLINKIERMAIQKKLKIMMQHKHNENQKKYLESIYRQTIEEEFGGDPILLALSEKIKNSKMPPEAREKAQSEFEKLRRSSSQEAAIIRTYIDFLCDLPWGIRSELEKNLNKAEKILDETHYGLEKIKEAIVMHIAVSMRAKGPMGNVLCFVGPPGVGKTSLSSTVAKALGRKFIRFALGGVKDEAEIRGHRRTYLGSMAGKILNAIKNCGTMNPVFLLDEIDKTGRDFRGDVSDALLEVLDPEQNHEFTDHYLEVPFPLNECFFICTANDVNKIPAALYDRMEVIQLSSYTHDEKLDIAKKHLVKKQMIESGALDSEFSINDKALGLLIDQYTRESGVRDLSRKIKYLVGKAIMQNVKGSAPLEPANETEQSRADQHGTDHSHESARNISPESTPGDGEAAPSPAVNPETEDTVQNKKHTKKMTKKIKLSITASNLEKYLGPAPYSERDKKRSNQIGVINGLAWSAVGGSVLMIQTSLIAGRGKIISTGSLGNVMEESTKVAFTCIKSMAKERGFRLDMLKDKDIHVHFPAGATPKDGPSAGCAIALSILSVLLNIPISSAIAITGEISLNGESWPIGGLKEKLLAAHRSGVKTVLIPESNRGNVIDIPQNVLDELKIVYISHLDDALRHALVGYTNQFSVGTESEAEKAGLGRKTKKTMHASSQTNQDRHPMGTDLEDAKTDGETDTEEGDTNPS
jgi:ATP-dependent Lon protease